MTIVVIVRYKIFASDTAVSTWRSAPIGTDNRATAILRAGAEYYRAVPNSQIQRIATLEGQ